MNNRSRITLILIYAVQCLASSGIVALGRPDLMPTAGRYLFALVAFLTACGFVAEMRALERTIR